MNSKKWTISFVIIILICLLFIVSVNFFVDPYGYFRAQKGENYTMDEEDYLREQKAEHIKYHGDEYDAFLVGGSKAGAIHSDKLSEIDGYKYYNCWLLSGNFEDYYNYCKYIINTAHPKKILLHISTSEIAKWQRLQNSYSKTSLSAGIPLPKKRILTRLKRPAREILPNTMRTTVITKIRPPIMTI